MFTSDNWINGDLWVAALQGDWKNPCCMDELDPHLTSCVGAKPFLPSLPPWWFLVVNKESCSSRIYNVQTRVLFLLTERGVIITNFPLIVNQQIIYFIIHWTFYGNLWSYNSLCVAVPSYPKEEWLVSSFHIFLGGGEGEGEGTATSRLIIVLEHSVNIQ